MQKPFEYDPEENVLRFKDKSSAILLASMLTKGKFGDYLDDHLITNKVLAGLLKELSKADNHPPNNRDQSSPGFSKDFLFALGGNIARNGHYHGFWQMTREQQIDFIQEVVAAPHTFLPQELEVIFDAIDSDVHFARELAKDAQGFSFDPRIEASARKSDS